MRANLTAIAERAASLGEPWLSMFNPPDMAALLQARRFAAFEDVTRAELAARYYGELGEGLLAGPGPHVVRASSSPRR
jgi:O-methyltransferase involved in polyketide biosynthesis